MSTDTTEKGLESHISQYLVEEISPGKSIIFLPIAAASTGKRLLIVGVGMMCYITLLYQPHMQFIHLL